MTIKQSIIQVSRWQGSQHPSTQTISQMLKAQKLTPYLWTKNPNYRYPISSHNYDKVLYVVEGTIEVLLPDSNQTIKLRVGDRIEIPASTRHGLNIGLMGAKCIEAAIRR